MASVFGKLGAAKAARAGSANTKSAATAEASDQRSQGASVLTPLPSSLDPKYLQQIIPADNSLRNRALGSVGHPLELSRDVADVVDRVLDDARAEFRADVVNRIGQLKRLFDSARDNPIDAMLFPSSAADSLFEIKASGGFAGAESVGTLAGSLFGFLADLNPSEDKHLAITGLIIDSMQLALASTDDAHFLRAVEEMIRLVTRAIERERDGLEQRKIA